MSEAFKHGYAVVIGVDENNLPRLALPAVAKDVGAVYDVLVNPERCAYLPDNVRLLKGTDATRDNIMEALNWLKAMALDDPNETAVLYYSGHGGVRDGKYCLVPYDIKSAATVYDDALPATEFNELVNSIPAQRMLVVLDCCHAGGMGAKDLDSGGLEEADGEPIALEPAAFPIDLVAADIPEFSGDTDSKGMGGGLESVDDLLEGEGRAVLNASTGEQKSWVRSDQAMSLFTYHFIEALTGHASRKDDTVVYVTDVMSWVTREVKKSAADQKREQTPVMRTTGVFPIAMLIGGEGLGGDGKGLDGVAPDPLASLPAVHFNQEGQVVQGPQVNAGHDVTIGHLGNNFVGDNVDKKVSGDNYEIGDMNNVTGVAVGPGAQANVTTTNVSGNGGFAAGGFGPLRALVAAKAPSLVGKVDELSGFVSRGTAGNDKAVAGLVFAIAQGVPGSGTLIKTAMAAPEAAAAAGGPITQVMLEQL